MEQYGLVPVCAIEWTICLDESIFFQKENGNPSISTRIETASETKLGLASNTQYAKPASPMQAPFRPSKRLSLFVFCDLLPIKRGV